MNKSEVINEIILLNKNAIKDELERLSSEHLEEILEYWRTKK